MASTKTRGHSRIEGKGPFIFDNFRNSHVIWPGREPYLICATRVLRLVIHALVGLPKNLVP